MIEVRASYNPGQVLANQVDGQLAHNPDLPLFTFYNSWVGGDDLSLAAALFYALLPVGAALPFGWSYCTEHKSGYLKNIYTRVDKKTYLAGKALAVFLSGAGAVADSPPAGSGTRTPPELGKEIHCLQRRRGRPRRFHGPIHHGG